MKTKSSKPPQSPTYNSWRGMKQRCLNPNHFKFDRYGGRGIEVCERWLDFRNFYEDMGLNPWDSRLNEKITTVTMNPTIVGGLLVKNKLKIDMNPLERVTIVRKVT